MAHVKDKGYVENFLKREGRLNRWRYFKRMFALLLISEIVVIVVSIIAALSMPTVIFSSDTSLFDNLIVNIAKVVGFLLTPAYFCLMVRRLHDLNQSEAIAYVAVAVICVNILSLDLEQEEDSILEIALQWLNFAFTLYLLFFPGTKGNNKYGSDPLEK